MWNKFRAVKKEVDGRSFASGLEADTYSILKLRMRAGEFTHIQCQDHVSLGSKVKLIVDFKVTLPDGSFKWIEAKGLETAAYRIKRNLWFDFGPGLLEVYKKSGNRIVLFETIKGKGIKINAKNTMCPNCGFDISLR